MLQVIVTSELSAEPSQVLARIATLEWVNGELRPWLTMTVPERWRGRSLFEAPVGEPLLRSWLLLGGIVPIDFDDIMLESSDPTSGFQESSTMLSMKVWRHERRVLATSTGGSRVIDRLELVPRIPGTGWLLQRVVRQLFEHRHRRLRRAFGSA
jgi:hypothetical protein